MSAKSQVRNHFRKEILNFTKGQDLKGNWVINKPVQYNGVDYENKEGVKVEDCGGFWRMGWTIRPCEGGYLMMHWTVVNRTVSWNAEIRFNKKMTPMCGYVNLFMGSPKFYSDGESISREYLLPLIKEDSASINSEKGFVFK